MASSRLFPSFLVAAAFALLLMAAALHREPPAEKSSAGPGAVHSPELAADPEDGAPRAPTPLHFLLA